MWRLRAIDKELYTAILEIEGAAIKSKQILVDKRDSERAYIIFYAKFKGRKSSKTPLITQIADILDDVGIIKSVLLSSGSKEARRIFKGQFPRINLPKKKAPE